MKSAISSWVWLLFGFCFMLIAIVYGVSVYKPNESETDALKANTQLCQDEAAKQSKAEKRVKDAVQAVKDAGAKWAAIETVKSPGPSLETRGINVDENTVALTKDAPKFRNFIQTAVNHQILVGGVKIVGGPGPQIPDPGMEPSTIMADYFNYPAIPFPVVIYDLGPITVEGTYSQIMANVRAWANMPNYMAVADGLTITGTSPKMHGTYSVTVIGYIHATSIPPPIPEVPSSGQGNAGGGIGGRSGGLSSMGGR